MLNFGIVASRRTCCVLWLLYGVLGSIGVVEMAYSQASVIKDVLADERACAIIEQHLPGATTHPYIDDAKYMTIGELMSFPQAIVIRKKLQAILDELAGLS